MNIRWNNIVAAILGMAALIFALRNKESCEAALDSINQLGPSNPPDERLAAFMVLGLIGICIVAIVKILASRPNDRRGRRDEPPED